MSFYKVKPEALAILTPEDRLALQGIYKHRCLNEEQLTAYYYASLDNGQNNYTLLRIRALIDAGFLEVYEYGEDQKCVFYLTHMGVQLVRDESEAPLTREGARGGPKYEINCSSLRMGDNLLDHQTQLNTLSLEIERRCGLDPSCYKDSVFTSNFSFAQPDGVFELPGFDIFLEMDMGHERLTALRGKWEHYRSYLNSRDYYLRRDKKLVVLFATQQVTGLERRRVTVVKSINQMIFDLVSPKLDFYVGNNEEMIRIAERIVSGKPGMFERVGAHLQNKLEFTFSRPKLITEVCRESYLYMRIPGEDGKPVVRDGRPQEYLFENYTDRQILGLKRASAYGQTQSLLKGKIGRTIPLLILAPSENAIFRDLATIDAKAVPDVYYITAERLKDRPFYEAVFQFDKLGNRFHFTDWSLENQVYEKNETK